jgi:hypothetical protein
LMAIEFDDLPKNGGVSQHALPRLATNVSTNHGLEIVRMIQLLLIFFTF